MSDPRPANRTDAAADANRKGSPVRAVILAVGDELISGATVDTNSAWLSRQLGETGIPVVRHQTVGDEAGAIAAAIAAAADIAEIVLVTGGLGPTLDDLSRQGLAEAMGSPLVEDPRSLERISAFFAARSRQMKPSNRTQALVPAGAEAVDNDAGTAPGLAARVGRADVYILPGPPHEMEAMFAAKIAARLPSPGAIARRLIHTFGTGESDVGEMLADLMRRGRNPAVGTTAKAGVITVRITASGPTGDAADALAEADLREVRSRLGQIVFGEGDQTLSSAIGDRLRRAGQTVATAESCTGGMIGEMIVETPGSSDYYLGGIVAYANAAKVALLGVDQALLDAHGAVSEPVAAAMAEGARRRFGTDWAVADTGIAGPGGAAPDKPVGLVFTAVAGPDGVSVRRHVFPGSREIVRRRASMAALDQLRRAIAG